MFARAASILLVAVLILTGRPAAVADDAELYERSVHPLLAAECFACHGPDATPPKGGLLLAGRDAILRGGRRGPAVVPGRPGESLLLRAVERQDAELRMPPEKELSAEQVAVLRAWIARGAPGPRDDDRGDGGASAPRERAASALWSFRPPVRTAPPPVRNAAWPRGPLDRWILAALEAAGLEPSPEADRRTLIRRLAFDLWGLPPAPEEVAAFVADERPDAYERLVERMLASPRYGERWGRHWLDVARYADTKGYVYSDREDRRFVHAHVYRDWVIRALNEDLPYNRFLELQIAADAVVGAESQGADADAGARAGDLAAMGFLTLGPRFLGVVHDIIDDRLDVIFRGTQGLSLGCARCHDHKYDPISMEDYYALYGVLASSAERIVPVPDRSPAPAAARAAYREELAKREAKLRDATREKRGELSAALRRQNEAYLVAVLDVEKLPSEEFYAFVQKGEVNPVIARRWHAFLITEGGGSAALWEPWRAFARLPPESFATDAAGLLSGGDERWNPLLVRALAAEPLGSMRDVAVRYGKLLDGVESKWQAALAAATASGETLPGALVDPDEEEIRKFLHEDGSPTTVPDLPVSELEWFFDEGTRVALAKLGAEIEAWHIESPGASPHAVILTDKTELHRPRIFLRGDPKQKGPEVPRRFLAALSGPDAAPFQEGSGRLELARAIASRENPLTARVIVNRIWQQRFGVGLVERPSDFGARAADPSHPELLDELALDLVRDGWSLKSLHRTMVLSSAYRQASDPRPESTSRDPTNRLLSRMPVTRLEFEPLRDTWLAAAGLLDLRMGGRSVDLLAAPAVPRRAVYGFVDRQFFPSVLRIFDVASPDQHSPARFATIVPQQALYLLNGPFAAEVARALAARSRSDAGDDAPARVRALYARAFQRAPRAEELELALGFIARAEARAARKPAPPAASLAWSYGYAPIDPAVRALGDFTPLPHFTGEAWQGGPAWPDAALGWARITAGGGHTGNDLAHAVVRRWRAPAAGTAEVRGSLRHPNSEGEGVRGWVFASRGGVLGSWEVHESLVETSFDGIAVAAGDTIDFVVDVRGALGYDDFEWAPRIELRAPDGASSATPSNATASGGAALGTWDAARDFHGPAPASLGPWELYAQTLLLANELLFVD